MTRTRPGTACSGPPLQRPVVGEDSPCAAPTAGEQLGHLPIRAERATPRGIKMLVGAGVAGDAADLRADDGGIGIAPGIAIGAESGLPQQLIDAAGRQAEALAQHV